MKIENIWHAKLDHPNIGVRKPVFKRMKIKYDHIIVNFCDACRQRKLHYFPLGVCTIRSD